MLRGSADLSSEAALDVFRAARLGDDRALMAAADEATVECGTHTRHTGGKLGSTATELWLNRSLLDRGSEVRLDECMGGRYVLCGGTGWLTDTFAPRARAGWLTCRPTRSFQSSCGTYIHSYIHTSISHTALWCYNATHGLPPSTTPLHPQSGCSLPIGRRSRRWPEWCRSRHRTATRDRPPHPLPAGRTGLRE